MEERRTEGDGRGKEKKESRKRTEEGGKMRSIRTRKRAGEPDSATENKTGRERKRARVPTIGKFRQGAGGAGERENYG
jgi:hypothetical protein